MEMWMIGLALAALLVAAARDVGRADEVSALGLLCLRGVGGAVLLLMAVLAVRGGHPAAAVVGTAGATPLLAGLTRSRRRARVAPALRDAPIPAGVRTATADAPERRAA